MSNKLLTITGTLIFGIIIFIGGVYIGNNQLYQANSPNHYFEESTASMMFDYGDGNMQVFYDIAIDEDTTLFHIIDAITTENNIDFGYEDYRGGMGVFVVSINGVSSENTPDRWWQYWVNNTYGKLGVSNYIVQPGDVILLKFMSSQL